MFPFAPTCFYTGSIKGEDGASNDRNLLQQLADKQCTNYKTWGVEGTDLTGMAKLNYDLFNLFAFGNFQLSTRNCLAARRTTKQIITKMYVPMIQSIMHYAFKASKL